MESSSLPRLLGRYRLLSRIGAGGMGEVYEAELTGEAGFKRRCAVKMVLPHKRENDDVTVMFEREAVLSARVFHDNVVQVFDFGKDEVSGALYLVMEYVDGLSLRALAERVWRSGATMPLDETCTLVGDVARGLAAIHGLVGDDGAPLDVVHRDVTPDNVLVTRSGVAKLSDFGIAVARDVARLTETGELKGKIPYMAPEQLDGAAPSSAADVFSLGVSLYHLLTGRRPFDRGTELATMNAIVKDDPVPLDADRPDAPPALVALLGRVLAKRPADRPTAAEFAAGLAAAVPRVLPTTLLAAMSAPPSSSSSSSSSSSAPRPAVSRAETQRLRPVAVLTQTATSTSRAAPSPTRSTRSALVAAAVAALGVGALAVAVFVGGSDAPDVVDAVVDAGAPIAAVVDAGAPIAAVVDAGSVVVDAGPAVVDSDPVTSSTAFNVELVGPAGLRWTTVDGKALGHGTTKAKLATRPRSVLAFDAHLGARCVVPVVGGAARFNDLGTGTLDVRANPFADVVIGTQAFGTTPLKPLPSLPAGCSYKVTLSCEGKTRTETVAVTAGASTPLRVSFE